jgi:ketol-acid reductoisomerase
MNVIVGVRKDGPSWQLALEDGWVPGKTLFDVTDALERGNIYMYLLSDAGQKDFWPTFKPYLQPGKTLYFSHGFSLVYHDLTGVVPPSVSTFI